jgi:hypothetical protein
VAAGDSLAEEERVSTHWGLADDMAAGAGTEDVGPCRGGALGAVEVEVGAWCSYAEAAHTSHSRAAGQWAVASGREAGLGHPGEGTCFGLRGRAGWVVDGGRNGELSRRALAVQHSGRLAQRVLWARASARALGESEWWVVVRKMLWGG